ncbi:MAG: hypothetical protein ACKO8O_08420 [Betaproteobacteria bacterium]
MPPPLSAPLSNPASPHSEGIGRGAIASDRTAWLSVAITVSAYALIWSMAQWLSQPNLDRYHDMLESFAWSQTFEWGSFKHPPFFAWVTGAWFAFMPRTDFAFNLLSYANVAVGLLGVAVLARLAGLGRFAAPAVILLFWCLPYTTLAAKFNANAQLLSVWPRGGGGLVRQPDSHWMAGPGLEHVMRAVLRCGDAQQVLQRRSVVGPVSGGPRPSGSA